MASLDDARRPLSSHLFKVRLWIEELGNDQSEYRGKVQHVASGETHYFRDWTTLEDFLTTKARDPAGRAP